ncbi:transcription cofactor vestigial-like protein 3 [Syngnathus acus]|uniref:transcription cofactor vestigial-like protein 3 n=1 Tax=Syngnathus acus TaxID=161584 RepID=UPI0018863875|nr:transcription cofactor vestigial-like protein 3 [Syngnathus acus]XP_037096388.1 transcription cofactor vestigial-like protein 3 [Syngnathus acus]XP_037096389.1 transcription cofactor vestigial-like protein 3 [Syngnathus acus]XP_037096390.1 transcription cofactor vestigial-like protein 3 [Syngnathus acus]XP_037096391.1 transcription cofactor vestigial-like protein 3 [Syngnathus acus]XP_037096392.1 transcription cofactor vestigial-like protein 3 [Syngnathus acus]
MSCLDVMYHQSYGAHLLPAEAYKSTYYNHHCQQQQQQQQQQQRKLSSQTKMHNCSGQQQGGGRGIPTRDPCLRPAPGTQSGCLSLHDLEVKDGSQPAGAEYLNSRCILFTYFQGDISDVVDEHFSRALSQSAGLNREPKPSRMIQTSASNGSWKDGESLQNSPTWSSAYPSPSTTCLPSVSLSDFSPSPISLNPADGGLWAGHVLSQAGLQPLASLTDSWTYSLNPQSTSSYPNVHDVYHPHHRTHIHTRHHHRPMLHSYPSPGTALESRFSPLLLPGVRNQSQSTASAGSSPLSESAKTEMDPSSCSPITATSIPWTPSTLHGSLELYDSAHEQTKAKSSVWF